MRARLPAAALAAIAVAACGGAGVPPRCWSRLPAAPTGRLEVAAAAVRGRIHVAGGLTMSGATAKVEILDPRRQTWRPAPDLPIALHHAAGVSYRRRFTVIGGFAGSSFDEASDRVFAMHRDRWVELPRLRRPRAAAGAAVVGGEIVLAGGQAGGALVAETERFDGRRWRDAAPIPTPRDHLAVGTDEEAVYAIGGRELAIERNLGVLERYDPATDRWESLPPMPTKRGGIGAAFFDRRIWVVGGEGSGARRRGVFEEVEAFSPASGAWTTEEPLPTPRHGVGVAVGRYPASDRPDALYVIAGGPELGLSVSGAVEAFRSVRCI